MIKNPRTFVRIGMASLVLSQLCLWSVRRIAGMPVDLIDGLGGVFLGIALGTLFIAAKRGAFRRPGNGMPPS